MPNRLLFAIPLTVILGGLALLHAYWALDGRWGSACTVPTVNGRRIFDPSPLATWIVCGLLGLAVILTMGRAGWIGTRRTAARLSAAPPRLIRMLECFERCELECYRLAGEAEDLYLRTANAPKLLRQR